jgi:hypothetical protein
MSLDIPSLAQRIRTGMPTLYKLLSDIIGGVQGPSDFTFIGLFKVAESKVAEQANHGTEPKTLS